MTLQDILNRATRRFQAAGADAPRLSARLLACRVLGCSRVELELRAESELMPEELRAFAELAERRAAGEPVALLLGEKEFYGRMFAVTRDTLIPRPESELLVELALDRLPAGAARIADFGTGTGCLGLALCAERPAWGALLVDISQAALDVAALNAGHHSLRGRALPVRGDLCRPPLRPGSLDCIVSNPPYVSETEYAGLSREVRDFEPRSALVPPGGEGLEHLRALADAARVLLRPGGRIFAEFGAEQGRAVEAIFTRPGLSGVRIHKDLAGHDRCVEAVRKA